MKSDGNNFMRNTILAIINFIQVEHRTQNAMTDLNNLRWHVVEGQRKKTIATALISAREEFAYRVHILFVESLNVKKKHDVRTKKNFH